MKIPKRINVKTALIFVAIGILITSGLFYVFAATPSSTIYISPGVYPGAPSYTIWREGSNYFAKNAYGQIASGFSGTNFSDIINNCIDALPVGAAAETSGGTIELVEGIFEIDSSILIDQFHVTIQGQGRLSSEIRIAGDFDGIVVTKSMATIRDLRIGMTGSVDPYNSAALKFTSPTSEDVSYCLVEDVVFRRSYFGKGSESGYAIYLHTTVADGDLYFNSFNHIFIDGSWQCNLNLTAEIAGSSINGNYFSDIKAYHAYCNVHTNPINGVVNSNWFSDLALQDYYATSPLLIGGTANILYNIRSWDMPSGTVLTILASGWKTQIIGGVIPSIVDNGNETYRLESVGTAFPTNPSEGQQFYHVTNNLLYFYNGTQWVDVTTGEQGPAGPPGATTQFGAYTFIIYKNATAVATQARDWRGALHYSDADADTVFQDCIDEMDFYNEGGIIFVKNGTYTFDTRVQVDQSGITIKGESQQAVTFSWNGGTNNFMWQIENGYTELRDFSIDMNDVSGCTAIWIDNSPRNIIYNIEITEVAVDGIYLNSTGETNSNRIEKCTIRQPGRSGVYIDDDIGHTLVNDCVISDRTSGTKVTDYGIYSTSDEKENKFTNNRIWGVINGICLDDVTAVIVQGNVMTDNDRCILLLQSNNDVLISGNRFWYTNRVNPTTDDNRSDIVFESSSKQWCGVITGNQGHGQSVARHFIWCSNIDIMEQWVIDGNACLEYADTEYDQGAQSGLTLGDNT